MLRTTILRLHARSRIRVSKAKCRRFRWRSGHVRSEERMHAKADQLRMPADVRSGAAGLITESLQLQRMDQMTAVVLLLQVAVQPISISTRLHAARYR